MEAFHKALRVLESCGANIVHGTNYAGLDELNGLPNKERQLLVLAGCFKTDIKEYLGNLTTNPHALKDLDDVIRLTKQDAKEGYPERGIDLFELARSVDISSAEFQATLKQNDYFAGDGGIPGTLKANQLDLLVAPAMYGPTVSFAARAGLHIVVVPLGKYREGPEVKHTKSGPDTLVDIVPKIPCPCVWRILTNFDSVQLRHRIHGQSSLGRDLAACRIRFRAADECPQNTGAIPPNECGAVASRLDVGSSLLGDAKSNEVIWGRYRRANLGQRARLATMGVSCSWLWMNPQYPRDCMKTVMLVSIFQRARMACGRFDEPKVQGVLVACGCHTVNQLDLGDALPGVPDQL
jgi:hypothetical protein